MPDCPYCGKFLEISISGTEDAKDLKDLNTRSKNKKIYYGDFVQLTVDEYGKLLEKFGKDDLRRRIDRLDHYIGSVGRRYKSHYHTVLSWSAKDPPSPRKPESEPDIHRPCACGRKGVLMPNSKGVPSCNRCLSEEIMG